MKNAPINRVGSIRNLGRWRLVDDLKKDKTPVLVCGPQFGNGYQIMAADICELHNVKYWQPLDPTPSLY